MMGWALHSSQPACMSEQLPKSKLIAPYSAKADTIFFFDKCGERFNFERVGLPLVWIQRAINIENFIVWIELQFGAIFECERLSK